MEKKIFIYKPTLQFMTIRTVAKTICYHPDILPLFLDEQKYSEAQIKHGVAEKVLKLLIPVVIKELLFIAVLDTGYSVQKWMKFHQPISSNQYLNVNLLGLLNWTTRGLVDYRKTAETLIKQERIDVIFSYELACIFCLDDIIKTLWRKLDDDSKKLFYNEEYIYRSRQPRLVAFWTDLMRGEDENQDIFEYPNQSVFSYAAMSGNIAATKYFFQKLKFEERDACLLKTVRTITNNQSLLHFRLNQERFMKISVSSVLFYLLSEMTEEQQIQVYKEQTWGIVRYLMSWAWIYVPIAELMWNILPVDDCYLIWERFSRERNNIGSASFQLFVDFLACATIEYRNRIVEEIRQNGIKYADILLSKDTEIMKSAVRNVHKKNGQVNENELHLCWKLIQRGRWSLLELFISACRLSIEAKMILKSSFAKYITPYYKEDQIKQRRRVCEKFFQLIDNANVTNKKIIQEIEGPNRKLIRKE